MSGGGNDDFVEERCAPMRRNPSAPKPGSLPTELKPKFPKPEEIMPADPQPQEQETPQTPSAPEQSPIPKTSDHEIVGPTPEENINQEVPSKDVESIEPIETKKKKKKASKKPKKEEIVGMAVIVNEDELNVGHAQFVDNDDEKIIFGEKPKIVEKDSNRDKNKEGAAEKKDEKQKVKKPKQPKTESCRQKQKAVQSGRQKKQLQASSRKPVAPKPPAAPTVGQIAAAPSARVPPPPSAAQPPVAPSSRVALMKGPQQTMPSQVSATGPGQPPGVASTQVPVAKAPLTAKEKERLAKEPNEGFLKAMYARAKQKVMAMKAANPVPTEASIGDDTLIANENEIIKPEVTAVYGAPNDYPKKVIPPKTDKSHPDKLFPAGRPFWMNRDEKPPQARVIMMSVVEQCLKQKTFEFIDNPPRTDPFVPYCENFKNLQKTDTEYFTGYKLLLSNTSRNCCVMRAAAIKVNESERLKPRKKSTVPRKPKVIANPPFCQVYNRKDQKKKPPSATKTILMGKAPKKKKVKKTQSSSNSSSNSSAD